MSLYQDKKCYINGQWVTAKSNRSFPVADPFNKKVIADVADCGAADATLAINAAFNAQKSWPEKPAKERAQRLRAWFDLIMSRKGALAALLTSEQGKPIAEAEGEVVYGASFVEWFSEEAKRIHGDVLESPKLGQKILVTKSPVGVCLLVTPWNFPVAMITRKAAPALAAGCSVIIKPAEETPLCALALASLAEEAGIPPGVINVLTTREPAVVVEHLMADRRVRKISFTGSTQVGKRLMQQAASNLQKVSLELGGNAPFIVFDDADFEKAITGAMASKFRNAGQTCVCTNRFIVQRALADRFAERLSEEARKLTLGCGADPDVVQGPLINEAAVRKVEEHISDAVNLGAEILCGGARVSEDNTLFYPTVMRNVTPEMKVNLEETFGPLAAIIPFDTEEEAVAISNNTDYGLAAYLYTENLGRALRVSSALEYGMVGVNEGVLSNEVGPFGGVKASGLGREGSKYGIEEYLELKYVLIGGL